MKKLVNCAALLAVVVFALTLGACGGGEDSSEDSPETPTVVSNKITVDITFDANGGSIVTTTFSKEDEYSLVTLPTAESLGLSRTAYTFIGWAKASDATKAEYSDAQRVKFTESTTLTLYAVWKQGYAATASTLCDVIKSLTADATVVVTGESMPKSSDWDTIATALAEVPAVNVTLDFSANTVTSYSSWGYNPFSATTNLVAVVLPNGYAGGANFYSCASLASVTVSDDNENYASVDGVLYNKDKTELLLYPAGKTAPSFTVPDTVTTIASRAFCANKYLTSVTTPDGIDTIKGSAFRDMTALETVTLGADLTTIESYAFSGCTALATANFNNKSCLWIIKKYETSTTPETSSCVVNQTPSHAAQWLTAKKITFGDTTGSGYCDYYWLSPFGTITYDANGGTITATETTQRYKYATSAKLKTADELGLTRSGYTFKGWAKTANAVATDASSYYWISYSASGDYDVTLYAVWEEDAE